MIDTKDTDIYVQAAYVAQKTSGLLCMKRKHPIIFAQCLCNEAMAESIIPLHVLTGCDHNSSFYGAGKTLIADSVKKSPEAQQFLTSCGTQLPITDEIIGDLEKFIIKYVYNDHRSKTLGQARAGKWRSLKRKSTTRLPPTQIACVHITFRRIILYNTTRLQSALDE